MRFHSRTLAALATVAASIDARMEEPAAPTNETEFVSYMAAKMEKAEAERAGKAPSPAPKGDEPDEEEVEDADESDSSESGDDDEVVDEGEVEEEPDESDEDDEPDGGGENEEEEEADDEDDSDPEFTKAADSAKLPTALEDLPEEVRPIVQKRLKEMEAGFTRAMQRANEYRGAERQFRTEEAYRKAHPVEWLAEQLAAHPELEEKVAAQLEKLREDPDYRESRKVLNQRDREAAAKEVAQAEAKEREHSEWLQTRSTEVETLAKNTCRGLKIPFDRGVEAAIAYEIREKGDIDNARIKEIVEQIAVERGASLRAVKREEKKRLLKGKKETQERAPRLKPGQGRAGGSTKDQSKGRSLEENMAATAAKFWPGEQ
jgi:hypothetical protein